MYQQLPDFDQGVLLDNIAELYSGNAENNYEIIYDSIKISKVDDKLVICITLYNESEQALLISLYAVSTSIENLYDKIGVFNKVTVTIIADGIDKLSLTTVNLLKRLKLFNNRQDLSRFGVNIFDNLISIVFVKQYFTEKFQKGEIDEKWTSLYSGCNKTKVSSDKPGLSNYEFRVLLIVKQENKGKLNSHWWFFKVLCKKLNPNYCFQLDVGTAPGPEALYHFWKFMENNKHVGASASRVQVPSPKKSYNLIHAWQYGDFAAQKLLDWPAEIMSGYLTVIPGQFCVFRWEALSSNHENRLIIKEENTPLDYYFRGMSNLGPFESNMFLAEDRILGYEIISRKDSGWQLAYVPEVIAITDTCDSLTELFHQRRRWINSSFACNLWLTFKILNFLNKSGASLKQKIHTIFAIPWLIINCLIQWIFPSLILILIESLLNTDIGSINSNIISYSIKNFLLPIFALLMVVQIVTFYYKKLSIKTEKVIVITSIIQTAIIITCIIYFIINHQFLLGNLNLITILLLECVILLFTAILVSRDLFHNLLKNIVQYMILRPFMLMLLTMYSFSNVHDCSWGTKGLNNLPSQLKSNNEGAKRIFQFKKFRVSTFMIWMVTNIFITTYFLLQSSTQKQSLLELLLYFFVLFTGFKVFAGLLFAFKSNFNFNYNYNN